MSKQFFRGTSFDPIVKLSNFDLIFNNFCAKLYYRAKRQVDSDTSFREKTAVTYRKASKFSHTVSIFVI